MKTRDLAREMRSVISDRDLIKLVNLIIAEQDGQYIMFNRYYINQVDKNWQVTSTAIQKSAIFSSLKSAAAFCIFHCSAQITDSTSIESLDTRLIGQTNNLEIYAGLLKKYPNSAASTVYLAKKQECELHIRQLRVQIKAYQDKSRDLQIKKFRAYQINTI